MGSTRLTRMAWATTEVSFSKRMILRGDRCSRLDDITFPRVVRLRRESHFSYIVHIPGNRRRLEPAKYSN